MRHSPLALLVALALTSACSSGGSSSGDGANASGGSSSVTESHSEEHIDLGSLGKTDNGPACPWNLTESQTFKDYQAIGVEISLDCEDVKTPSYSYQYSQDDLNETLAALDRALPTVRASQTKLSRISLGQHSFHRAREALIQLPMAGRGAPLTGVERFFDASLQLMDAEMKLFNGEVRLGYEQVRKARRKDGTIVDSGTAFLPAPTQTDVDADLKIARTFRTQILAHKDRFPDVVFDHGNGISFYEMDRFNGSYSLPSAGDPAEIAKFFHLLDRYETVAGKYAPLEVQMDVAHDVDGFRPDFDRSEKLLQLAGEMADFVKAQPGVKWVKFLAERPSVFDDGKVEVLLENGSLRVMGALSYFGKAAKPAQIRACLEKQDFASGSFRAECRL